jgi:hypothetical protein
VQSEVLLGVCCKGERRAPFDLKGSLPSALKSLTLYGYKGLVFNKTLGRQLQDVINSMELLPRLDYIALEMRPKDVDFMLREFGSHADPADPPHNEMEQTCRERGIIYETKPTFSCIKGGCKGQYYRSV